MENPYIENVFVCLDCCHEWQSDVDEAICPVCQSADIGRAEYVEKE